MAERVLTIDTLGAAHLAVPLSEVAETGLWSVQARLDPAGATLAEKMRAALVSARACLHGRNYQRGNVEGRSGSAWLMMR